jgi:hypothetical protein
MKGKFKKFRDSLSKNKLFIFDIILINLILHTLFYFYARNIFYNSTNSYYGGYNFPFENLYIIEGREFTGLFDILAVTYSFFEYFWYGIFPLIFFILWKKIMK